MDILFFGDLVGKRGREAVHHYLSHLENRPDVIIANVENTSHGFGLMEKHYNELLDMGIQIFTSGNHIWDKKEIFDYIPRAEKLLRPENFSAHEPGRGYGVFRYEGGKVGVINLIGQVFMGNYNSPWDHIDEMIRQIREETPIVFIDFHAEATAEKMAFAHHAAQLGASAMVGTHTHVQTADDRILNGRMGYLTDAGFNGCTESVIGMEPNSSIARLKSHIPTRLEVAESNYVQVNAVRFTIDEQTGICTAVNRVYERFHL